MENRARRNGGMTGSRGRWAVVLIWLALAGVLHVLLPAVSDEEINNAPNLPDQSPSVVAEAVADREFPASGDLPALIVWHREGGLTDADLAGIQSIAAQLTATPVPYQAAVPPLHQLPPQALKSQLSEDGSTFVSPVLFDRGADADRLKEGISELQSTASKLLGADPFAADSDGGEHPLTARVTGPVGITIDATGLFMNADVSLMIATVLLVLILLLLIYRSPLLALIPLVAVGIVYMTLDPLLGWMAHEGWITVDAQAISIMTVLLFGAGTDYCLFLISRYRQLLHHEPNPFAAVRQALSGSAGAIAMSGLTVVIALLALLAAQYGAVHRFAAPFSISILVMGIASLTLVPALLSIFGRTSFYPFVPRTPQMQAERAIRRGKPAPAERPAPRYRIGTAVIRRPVTIVVLSVVLLGALAGFVPQIKFTYDLLSSFPASMPSREGFAIIEEQYPPGELAPVQVIVDTQGKDAGIKESLAKLPIAAQISEPAAGSENADIQSYELTLAVNPYTTEAMNAVPDIRQAAEAALAAAGVDAPDSRVWIAGQTAEQYDSREDITQDTRTIIPIVIAMIALLLLLYLRSIVATVYLVLTVVLSYLSALGLGWIVLHYAMGVDAIQGLIPLYSFVFLVALGEDYNIFMISSIWKKRRSMPLGQAIREGVGETGSVITSAGLILAGTFAVLATLPIQVLVQFGLITAIGVLLDTFVVRPFVVPAITLLLGRLAFWPGKHELVAEQADK